MSVIVHPIKVFDYFYNIVDDDKTKNLRSFSIARSICHIGDEIDDHSDNCQCHCFSCRIFKLLLTVLLSRNYGRLYLKCAVHMNIFSNIVIAEAHF